MDSNDSDLLVETRDGVVVLTLNRPDRLNALSRAMLAGAIATVERCADDPAIGCIVLTGAGRGFCAGGDVAAMGDASAMAEWTMEQKVDRQRKHGGANSADHGHAPRPLVYRNAAAVHIAFGDTAGRPRGGCHGHAVRHPYHPF